MNRHDFNFYHNKNEAALALIEVDCPVDRPTLYWLYCYCENNNSIETNEILLNDDSLFQL